MSDPSAQPQGGAQQQPPREYTVTDEDSAARAIAGLGLLDPPGDEPAPRPRRNGQDQSGASTALDTGAPEGPTGGEPGEGEPAAPVITVPSSWTAEEKQAFAQLPPDLQAVVSRRESEREAYLTRQSQDIATERRGFEGEREAMRGQTQRYLEGLGQLLLFTIPEAQALAQVDWTRLSAENPAEAVRLQGMREGLQRRMGAVQAEIARVNTAAVADMAQRQQAYVAEQHQLLARAVPDFADQQKGPVLARSLGQWLQAQGFTAEEI